MIENFPIPKADNDNHSPAEEKEAVDAYNRISEFRDRLRSMSFPTEDIREIQHKLFTRKITPSDALLRVKKIAEENGIAGDL